MTFKSKLFIEKAREDFMEAMRDDFNTALAISYMFAMAKDVQSYKKALAKDNSKPDGKLVAMYKDVFAEMCSIIGVLEAPVAKAEEAAAPVADDSKTGALVEMIIKMRAEAKANKDYATADKLRNQLLEIGIALQDTKEGVKWSIN